MNKTLLITLGFVIAGIAIIMPFSQASRDAYHTYIQSPENKWYYNRFSEPTGNRDRSYRTQRINAAQQRTLNRTNPQAIKSPYENEFAETTFRPRNYRASYVNRQPSTVSTQEPAIVQRPSRTFSEGRRVTTTNQAQTAAEYSKAQIQKASNYRGSYLNRQPSVATQKTIYTVPTANRVFEPTIQRSTNNTVPSSVTQPRVELPATPAKTPSLYTYENTQFSIMLPEGWAASESDAHKFVSRNSDYEVRIKYFGKEVCGTSFGFTGCANTLSSGENYRLVDGAGSIYVTKRGQKKSGKSDTVLLDVNQQTDVFTERFNGSVPFDTEKTFDRYFVRDIDGGVYMIETTVPVRQSGAYVGTTKQIFESFRVYPTDWR